MTIQTIIDKFKNTFDLNGLHAKPVEYMDYEDVTDKVEQFLKDSLTSMLDGIEREAIEQSTGDADRYEIPYITTGRLLNIINSHR